METMKPLAFSMKHIKSAVSERCRKVNRASDEDQESKGQYRQFPLLADSLITVPLDSEADEESSTRRQG